MHVDTSTGWSTDAEIRRADGLARIVRASAPARVRPTKPKSARFEHELAV